MKTITNKWMIILLVIVAASTLSAMDDEQEKTKTFSVKRGEKLYTDLGQGDIKIKTWDKDEVLIRAIGLDSEQLRDLTFSYENKTVSVRYDADYEGGELVLQVTVPTQFNLDLKTKGGNISVMNTIEGNVMVLSYGGDLSFKSVKGDLRAETNGGNIDIVGNVNGVLDVNTMGGDINLGEIYGKSAKVNTMGGEIRIEKSRSGINVKTYGGDITIGDAGGDTELITFGGNIEAGNVSGNVRMETNGGNLDLKGANGKVKAKTNGGNVDFKKIKGSVDVKTSAGEVQVELDPAAGSESRIVTSAGSIELTVPSSAKTTIEARIHVQGWWKNSEDTYQIQSDFEEQSYETDDENHDIVATYVLNGGGSKIILRSVNDSIEIKKKLK